MANCILFTYLNFISIIFESACIFCHASNACVHHDLCTEYDPHQIEVRVHCNWQTPIFKNALFINTRPTIPH